MTPAAQCGPRSACPTAGFPERALRLLVAAHLLEEPSAGRYSCHDLLRHYAAERAGEEESAPARRGALARLYGYYLRTADTGRCPGEPAAGALSPG